MPKRSKKIFWCRSSNCPDGFSFTPGAYCKAALCSDVFIHHNCGFSPKTCTIDRDEAGLDDCIWIDSSSPQAKSLKKRDPKRWQGSWLKVPDFPRFQPAVGQPQHRQSSVPESPWILQQKQDQRVPVSNASTTGTSMHGHQVFSLSKRQDASCREAGAPKVTAHLPAGASSAAASSPYRQVEASTSEPERKRKQNLAVDDRAEG